MCVGTPQGNGSHSRVTGHPLLVTIRNSGNHHWSRSDFCDFWEGPEGVHSRLFISLHGERWNDIFAGLTEL